MDKTWRRIVIGLFGSILVVVITLQMTSASHVDGQYLPVGHDAFYHASRILEAVESGAVAQFDERMHAPEGDWVTWPWAYDALMAQIVRGVAAVTGADPMTIAVHVPPAFGVIGVWLVLAAAVLLGLSDGMVAVAVVYYGLHAYTQYQFGVGALDHHGAEQLAVLAVLVLGLRWLKRLESAGRAASVGLALGLALGIHAGLVVLQLPLLAALTLQWIRRDPVPFKSATGFAAGLVAGALMMLLPAETFWQGRFALYYLSWLQFYASLVTAVLVMIMSCWEFSRRAAAAVAVIAAALALPLLAALGFSVGFITGDLPSIAQIDEIRSPFAVAMDPSGWRRISQVYTLLVWIAPVVAVASVAMVFRERDRATTYFWIWSVFGLVLLLLQQRLGSLGVTFLYLTVLLLASKILSARPEAHRAQIAAISILLAVAYSPTLFFQLFGKRLPAMDEQYSTLRPIIPALVDICRREPGVMLVTPGDGHIVRYFTDCAVTSNNFRLTPADLDKISESLRFIGEPAARLSDEAPYVRYVLARLIAPAESPDPVLFSELLNPVGDSPVGFQTLVEVGVTQPDGSRMDYLGLFSVGAAPVSQSPASSPDTSTAETSSPATAPPWSY